MSVADSVHSCISEQETNQYLIYRCRKIHSEGDVAGKKNDFA